MFYHYKDVSRCRIIGNSKDVVRILESNVKSPSHIARLIIIVYVNGFEVPMLALLQYVGDYEVFYKAHGIALHRVTEGFVINRLKRLFLEGNITLAKQCLDRSSLENNVVVLTSTCINAIESSKLLSKLVRIVDALNKFVGEKLLLKGLLEYLVKNEGVDISDLEELEKLIAILNLLFPAKVKIICGDKDVYSLFVERFKRLERDTSRKVLDLFLDTMEEICRDVEFINVAVESPLILKDRAWQEAFTHIVKELNALGIKDAEAIILRFLGLYLLQSIGMARDVFEHLNISLSDEVKKQLMNMTRALYKATTLVKVLESCIERLHKVFEDNPNMFYEVLGSLLILLTASDQRFGEVSKAFPPGLVSRARDVAKDNAYVLSLCRVFGSSLE